MDPVTPAPKDELAVERWLMAMVWIHVASMLAMPLVLARFLPGGGVDDPLERVRLIAEHPWMFRLGWLPWQLTALVDFIFAVALVRARYLPKALTVPTLVMTLAAIAPDQYAQAMYVTKGVELAQTSAAAFLAWEPFIFELTAGWGATGYTLGTLVMLAAFWRGRVWSVALTRATLVFCVAMIPAAVAPLLPGGMRPPPSVVVVLNALGFSVLLLLYAVLLEAVLRRRIADEVHGRWAPWRLPGAGLFARAVDLVAGSRFFYALLEPVPVFAMASDITDVVYVNYLVDAERLAPLVPPGLELQRLGPRGDKAVFTFLTYRHGHFGFRFLGPLRRLSPSAVQTNWRIHVREPRTGLEGVFFVTNAIDHVAQALGARLFSEGMPMHVLERTLLSRDGEAIELALHPGSGSAPDAKVSLRRCERALPPEWRECFDSFEAMLAYVVPQNRALSTQPYKGRVTRQEIHLPIELAECVPLDGKVESRAARAFVGDAKPLCFHVPNVSFLFSEERHS